MVSFPSNNVCKSAFRSAEVGEASQEEDKGKKTGDEDFLPIHLTHPQQRPAESLNDPGHGIEKEN